MADRVRFILDRMATTFRSIEDLGIFTPEEVRSIIKRRTDHEYILMRRVLKTSDFYEYLHYEVNSTVSIFKLYAKYCFFLIR
jgi:U3 small nucleolar RNA-associated protein 6